MNSPSHSARMPGMLIHHSRTRGLFATILTGIMILASYGGRLFAANQKNYTYLALGDSVAFGLNLSLFLPSQPPPSPQAFKGYPEFLAEAEHLANSKKEANASCPGESSASFITAGAPDYGCYGEGPDGEPPFKFSVGLHTNYSGSQLAFAVSELSSNKHIDLVTLGIGSNDVLILLRNCKNDPDCVGTGIAGVYSTFAQNLAFILSQIRAHYEGTLILVKYYSPSPALDRLAIALNSTMEAAAAPFHVRFADGFSAFKEASAAFGGDACAAGLLVTLSGTCDIHPNAAGQRVLALAVQAVLTNLN